MTKKINLPCNGSGGNKSIKKEADTITFETSGSCTFTGFNFTDGTGTSTDGFATCAWPSTA